MSQTRNAAKWGKVDGTREEEEEEEEEKEKGVTYYLRKEKNNKEPHKQIRAERNLLHSAGSYRQGPGEYEGAATMKGPAAPSSHHQSRSPMALVRPRPSAARRAAN